MINPLRYKSGSTPNEQVSIAVGYRESRATMKEVAFCSNFFGNRRSYRINHICLTDIDVRPHGFLLCQQKRAKEWRSRNSPIDVPPFATGRWTNFSRLLRLVCRRVAGRQKVLQAMQRLLSLLFFSAYRVGWLSNSFRRPVSGKQFHRNEVSRCSVGDNRLTISCLNEKSQFIWKNRPFATNFVHFAKIYWCT